MKKHFVLCLLLVGQILAAPSEPAAEEEVKVNDVTPKPVLEEAPSSDEEQVHGTANKALESANRALFIYNKTLDTVISWDIFDEVIKTLEKHKGRYSSTAGVYVGEIKTFLMNSKDHYYQATQSIYNWCGEGSDLIEAYLLMFGDYNKEKAEAQKTMLISMLELGEKSMDKAISNLNQSSMNFNEASGKLETLDNQLSLDSKEESQKFQEEIQKVRDGQWSAFISPIGGLIYTIYNEVKTIPDLKKAMEQVIEFYSLLRGKVTLAIETIDKAKVELKTEQRIIGDMRSSTKNTHRFVKISHLMKKKFEEIANRLVKQCTDYRARHGAKTA